MTDDNCINSDQKDANDLLRGLSSEGCLNDGEGDETSSSQEIQDEVESDQSKNASKRKKNNKKREFMAYKYSNKKKWRQTSFSLL